MRAILDAMERQGIRDLASPGREALEGYVRRVVAQRRPPASLTREALTGTTWRLAYAPTEAPPPDATVYLKFHSDSAMQYRLQFGARTLGLNSIQADGPWQVSEQQPRPGEGADVTFVYDKVSLDAFGWQNIGTGLFGLLQGRSQTLRTAYYDGDYWIARNNSDDSSDADNGTSLSSFTIYVKEEDEDAWNK